MALKEKTALLIKPYAGEPCQVSVSADAAIKEMDLSLCSSVHGLAAFLREVGRVAHDPDLVAYQRVLPGSHLGLPMLTMRDILDRVTATLPAKSLLKQELDKVHSRVAEAQAQDRPPLSADSEAISSLTGYSKFVILKMMSVHALQTFSQQFNILNVTPARTVKELYDRIGELQLVTSLVLKCEGAGVPPGLISEITPTQAAQAMVNAMPVALRTQMVQLVQHPQYAHLRPTAEGALEQIRDHALQLELIPSGARPTAPPPVRRPDLDRRPGGPPDRRRHRVHAMADAGGEGGLDADTVEQELRDRIHALELEAAGERDPEGTYESELSAAQDVVAALKGKGGKDGGKGGKGGKGGGKGGRRGLPEEESDCWHCSKTGHFARNCPDQDLNLRALQGLRWEDIQDEIADGGWCPPCMDSVVADAHLARIYGQYCDEDH